MRTRQELKGNNLYDFQHDNQEELHHAISEAGLHCCDHCGYITAKLVRFKDYDFAQSPKLTKDYETLCDNCYEYFYAQDLVKPIKED